MALACQVNERVHGVSEHASKFADSFGIEFVGDVLMSNQVGEVLGGFEAGHRAREADHCLHFAVTFHVVEFKFADRTGFIVDPLLGALVADVLGVLEDSLEHVEVVFQTFLRQLHFDVEFGESLHGVVSRSTQVHHKILLLQI